MTAFQEGLASCFFISLIIKWVFTRLHNNVSREARRLGKNYKREDVYWFISIIAYCVIRVSFILILYSFLFR